jgi:hypothetical protein
MGIKMNKKTNSLAHPESGEDKKYSIQSVLERSDNYETGLVRLYNDLVFALRRESIPNEIGDEMLSIIVNDALNGVDIAKRYPTFFNRLLQDEEMQASFIDAIETAEKDQELPASLAVNIDFLSALTLKPSLEVFSKEKWRVQWKRTIDQLQAIFSPAELAYRSIPGFYDDPWFTLLRDEFEVDGNAVSVVLDGTLSEKEDDSIEVILKVALTDLATNQEISPNLIGILNWGEYQGETQIIAGRGGAFPPLTIATILDSNKENIIADLQLELVKEPA